MTLTYRGHRIEKRTITPLIRLIFFFAFCVSASVLADPTISITPTSLVDTLESGTNSAFTIKIFNTGTEPLIFDAVIQFNDSLPLSAPPSAPRIKSSAKQFPAFDFAQFDASAGYDSEVARILEEYYSLYPDLRSAELISDQPILSPLATDNDLFPGIFDANAVVIFSDDMESGVGGWTHSATHPNGIDQWALQSSGANSGSFSWRVTQHSTFGADALETPVLDLTDMSSAILRFAHYYNFDDCGNPTFDPDGGILEVSVVGDTSWTQVFPDSGYPYTLDNACDNVLALRPAYSHDGGTVSSFLADQFDLTAFAGQSIQVRFHAGWDCGNCSPNDGWFIDDVLVLGVRKISWMTYAPVTDTIAPGDSAGGLVQFHSQNLVAGQYSADLLYTTNDPANPVLTLPATLTVTGSPIISLSSNAFAFDSLLVGDTAQALLTVSNVGTDVLNVSAIVSDNASFSAVPGTFSVPPAGEQLVSIIFNPQTTGSLSAILTIQNDDPLNPSLQISASGYGLDAPVLSLSLDTLAESLLTDQTSSQTLTISNTGTGDLDWSVEIVATENTTTSLYTLTVPIPPDDEYLTKAEGTQSGTATDEARTTAISATLSDLTGVRILFYGSRASWSTLVQDLELRGAVVHEYFGALSSAILDTVDVFWTVDHPFWSSAEEQALSNWMNAGGSILLEGDESAGSYNSLLSVLGANVTYASGGVSGTSTDIFPHQTTEGVISLLMVSNLGHLSSVPAPAGLLINDPGGQAHCAYTQISRGRLIALSNEDFYDGSIGNADNQLFGNQIFDWLSNTVNWLSISPTSGTTPPAGSTNLSVDFDATGLFGGNYAADLIFTTNDPLAREAIVPTQLNVTGVPNILVTDTLFTFDSTFIGYSQVKGLSLSNIGTDTLHISSFSTDHADFQIFPATQVNLAPGQDSVVVLEFSPSTVGDKSGFVTISSDDPDQPTITIPFSGTGIVAPIISLSPDSLGDSLFTGQTATHQVTITNNGGSDLKWSGSLHFSEGSPTNSYTLTVPVSPNDKEIAEFGFALDNSATSSVRTTAITATLLDLTGVRILYDGSAFSWSAMIQDLTLRGAIVHEYNGALLPAILDTIDIVWILRGDYLTNADVLALSDWVTTGGAIFIEADLQIPGYNSLLSAIGANITYTAGSSVSGPATDIFPHETTEGVTDLELIVSNIGGHLSQVAFPAGVLYNDQQNNATAAYSQVGAGRVIAMASVVLLDGVIGVADNQLFGNQMFDWLSNTVNWLSISPTSGTTPPAGSTDLSVEFDATGLFGGNYAADLIFTTNDPLAREVTVPTQLNVTGVPNILVTDTLFTFDSIFIGYSQVKELTFSNVGTDTLHISSLSTDHSDFQITPAQIDLAPSRSSVAILQFFPSTAGDKSGFVTISSDDPDQPTITIPFSGSGIVPPSISLSPDSLGDSLFTGQTATHQITIINNGGSDLNWNGFLQFSEASPTISPSPIFGPSAIVSKEDELSSDPFRIPDESEIYRSEVVNSSVSPLYQATSVEAASGITLESILANLNDNFAGVNGSIPNRYDFFDGVTGFRIIDGGGDMYDGGNYLSTNFGGNISYSDNLISSTSLLGSTGSYFTRKYPGLFVFVADIDNVSSFAINGNLGADGRGNVDGAVLETTIAGVQYTGFVKRVFNAGDPSVNHLVIVAENPSATHSFSTNTNNDYHEVFNLTSSTRLYYLLYAGSSGFYIDNAATLNIMTEFIHALELAPEWISMAPESGSVAPASSQIVQVTLDAAGLFGGDYFADFVLLSNDSLSPESTIPVHLNVTGAPDISLSATVLPFDTLFIGSSQIDSFEIANVGTDTLHVSSITSDNPDFSASIGAVTLAPFDTASVLVTFAPSVDGIISGSLTILSDDVDEPSVSVALSGVGLIPPQIAVAPDSLFDTLFSDGISVQQLSLSNLGGSDLIWSAVVQFPGATSVINTSPIFESSTIVSKDNDISAELLGTLDESDIYRSEVVNSSTSPLYQTAMAEAAAGSTLESILASLNDNFAGVNSIIPNRYDFFDGVFGSSISDGGRDMYDGGNFLSTNLGGNISYSDNLINSTSFLGPTGRYFTRKYPGLFVFVADLDNVSSFIVTGNLGADGRGNVDGAVLETTIAGVQYRGFVKRVFNANDPSVNHLVIVADNPTATHSFSTNTNSDYHEVFNLTSGTRLYYLLYAGSSGFYIDNAATLNIMTAFIQALELGPDWISVTPQSGTVNSGASANLDVTLNAEFLEGGAHVAEVRFISNDSLNPDVIVAVSLNVIDAPNIALSDTLIDFDTVFIGTSDTSGLFILNTGAALLNLSAITSSLPEFTVSPQIFSVSPDDSQLVEVVFTPSSAVSFSSVLSFASDDPDAASVTATVLGLGVLPPIASATPDSLDVSLFTDDTLTQIIQLSNTGGSPLEFKVDVEFLPASSPPTYTLTVPSIDQTGAYPEYIADTSNTVTTPARTTAIEATLQDLTGVRVMFDRAHSQTSPSSWSTIISDLTLRGAILIINLDQITPALLANVDVLWLTDGGGFWTPTDISTVQSWVVSGGGLLIEGDGPVSPYNDILNAVGAGFTYISGGATSGVTTSIHPHTTTQDVAAININAGPLAHLSINSAPAEVLIDDRFGVPNTAYSTSGSGRIVAMADELFYDGIIGTSDNQLFANQVFDWLAGASGWAQVTPAEGIVAAGSSIDLEVFFDATALFGGDYNSIISITNNDPFNSPIEVPAHMFVTGIPKIEVSESQLSFDTLFIGVSQSFFFLVTNTGTDLLTVSSLTIGDPNFTVQTLTPFSLSPTASTPVTVTFSPLTDESHSADLTIASDAANAPTVLVALTGVGLIPPEIVVAPISITDTLWSDSTDPRSTAEHKVVIYNNGGSDLIWNLAIDLGGSPGAPGLSPKGEFENRVMTDFPDLGNIVTTILQLEKWTSFVSETDLAGPSSAPLLAENSELLTAVPDNPLENILASLDANFTLVNSIIPNRFDFSEGVSGFEIVDAETICMMAET